MALLIDRFLARLAPSITFLIGCAAASSLWVLLSSTNGKVRIGGDACHGHEDAEEIACTQATIKEHISTDQDEDELPMAHHVVPKG